MLLVQATDSKIHVRLAADRCGIFRHPPTISCKIVRWRATVDEDGQYCFAVAL
jgi:hypothetical protein